MCMVCARSSKGILEYAGGISGGPAMVHVAAAGSLEPVSPGSLIDTVPGDTSTTAELTVDGAVLVSAIDTIGDQDFFAVDLLAGQTYHIGMFGYVPQGAGDPLGPTGIPLLDAYIELYDSAGNFILAADGGSDTVLNSANSGFDALMTFTVTTSGTYYINARAFDNIPADGADGDLIGDYGIYVENVTDDPGLYTPHYDASSPLYAIDWGSQVDGTVRNPDGAESGHITGNSAGAAENPWGYNLPGKNVITIYFAQAGDVFVSEDLTNPGLPPATITATGIQQFEHDAVMTALAEFSKVADVVYIEVDNRDEANFIYTSYLGTPGPGVSLLGSMSPPGESDEGLAQFNSGDYRWNATDLQQGGFSFVTLIHEFGHGHGLAHPHDNGGRSGIMNGVEAEGAGVADYTIGDYGLNQAIFTMMSYEDGWQESPYGNAPTDVGYGYLGGLMAFDIAAIQDKYGVNEEWATGDDKYKLKDVNAAGTYYSSIWDAGGNDRITYTGTKNAVIDLRPATLEYEVGGGGFISYVDGIFGGFTIANGVVIEGASSGSGNDKLTGNDANNTLIAGAGNDTLSGGWGDDVLDGGLGDDKMQGGAGNDIYFVDALGDRVQERAGEGTDTVVSTISFTLGANFENLSLRGAAQDGMGNAEANILTGNAERNRLNGGEGNDSLHGGDGKDVLIGGAGQDRFYFAASGDAHWDKIQDFSHADDSIWLDRDVFTGLAADGQLAAGAFRLGSVAGDADDRILYDSATGSIFYDADGSGGVDAVLIARVTAGTTIDASDFFAF